MEILYRPIGIMHTPFAERRGTPIQPAAAPGAVGRVELDACYRLGLKDLDGFSHLILLYHFHRSCGYELEVTPLFDIKPYVPQLNPAAVERIGWFSGAVTDLQGRMADERFR